LTVIKLTDQFDCEYVKLGEPIVRSGNAVNVFPQRWKVILNSIDHSYFIEILFGNGVKGGALRGCFAPFRSYILIVLSIID